jgi:hypothetical protein
MKKIILLLSLSLIQSAYADNFAGKTEMNSIAHKTYQDFPTKWELITIRFRKDTGEMRLTYANKLAAETLKKGSINYPDGAVFAKTGIHTGVDPQFTSSVIPKGIRRYQYMVKDKKKFASTGGWGYALFDVNGKTFPEDPKQTVDACYACHTIVENRGDVFSEPFDFVKNTRFKSKPADSNLKINFEWLERETLPANLKSFIPDSHAKVRAVSNDKLKKNMFQGTLDELKPHLEQEGMTANVPVIFASTDSKRFVIVIPKKSDECMGMGSFEIVSTDLKNQPITEKFCTHD